MSNELATDDQIRQAKDKLNEQLLKIVHWHFSDDTGCPFWLERKRELKFDPLKDVKQFEDLEKFGLFEDEWLRGGPVRRWVPLGHKDKPVYTFETGGTTGTPKTRININDFRTDYEQFSHTLPDDKFPKGSNWLMLVLRVHGGFGWRSSIWPNIAAGFVSASILIHVGSSS